MGDSKALPGFGQVDLDIDFEAAHDPRAPAPTEAAPASAFGRVDLELDEPAEPVPPSTSRVFNAEGRPAGMRERAVSVHDESTRIVSGDALSAMTRSTSPPALHDDGSTRAWAEIDGALAAVDDTSASRSGNQPAPSASGVASRDDRVAAMRDLYARGDAAGALALASTLSNSMAPAGGVDSPDASIYVEFGEQSIDLEDPFGGLIPLDDDLAARATAAPPAQVDGATTISPPAVTVTMPPPGASLTLTERQSIPQLLIPATEISSLKIDHRAGFLLAHVDGMHTVEEILDICAMPSAEALELLANLKALGVIELN